MSTGLMQVIDRSRVPPGGYFRCHVEETGRDFAHPYLAQLEVQVKAHRRANNLPIGSNWEADFQDQVCRSTPSCPCEPADSQEKSLWKRALKFASAMTEWARAGFPLVDEATLQTRRAICEGGVDAAGVEHLRCQYWEESFNRAFGRCGKCGCNTGLKTAVATEHCILGNW